MFGRAYSNVFDGTKRLGSAKDGWMVLQGAPRRPSIGFLSLFEAYQCIEARKVMILYQILYPRFFKS